MNANSKVRPRITVLSQEQIGRVHQYSLEILATVGVRVDSQAARAIFARGSTAGWAQLDGDRVRLPRELVEWALAAAPASVAVYGRGGEPAFCLGAGQETRFGIGVTALYLQDPLTDQVTPFTRQHMGMMSRLGGALPSFDVISTPGVVQDVPAGLSDLIGALEMMANTAKPLVLLVSEEERYPAVLDLLAHLHGDLSARPFVIPYFNPITPLVINQGTADKMLETIERGLPFIYSNYGMAGATTPITPAGTLALLNAELLAGLTLSQLVKEGAPVILGILPAFFDMRGMANFYDPVSYLLDLACAELMAHYQVPHCGTSGSGMGWGADLIAGGHQWLNHLLSCLGLVGLAPFVGDNLGSTATSPAVIVYANEVIAQARGMAAGFALDPAAAALDEIAQVGPAGNFLTTVSTLKGFRTAYYQSALFSNLTLDEWRRQDQPRAEDRLREHTRALLDSSPAPDDRDELIGRGEGFITSLFR